MHAWKSVFLRTLEDTGNVGISAKLAGKARSTVYFVRETNEPFRLAWDDAVEHAADLLEMEALRRAREGVDEPVFYKGEECGVIRRYSDSLMALLLRAHRPEKYAEQKQISHTGKIAVDVTWPDEDGGDPPPPAPCSPMANPP